MTTRLLLAVALLAPVEAGKAQPITAAGQPAQLDVRAAGAHSARVTLTPVGHADAFPFTPAVVERAYPAPAISLQTADEVAKQQVGELYVEVRPDPLTIIVTRTDGTLVQEVAFQDDNDLTFALDGQPVLGMGEGGPKPARGVNWRALPVEFDRRGRVHQMQPRWQSDAYGSRNPVAMLVGTGGWGLFIATPWGQIDLTRDDQGVFRPRTPADPDTMRQNRENQQRNLGKGIPPMEYLVPGVYDLFIFDAHNPATFMQEVAAITGPAVMPPRWTMGYMQSHRTLEDDAQMVAIVDSFRAKAIPLDAVIYLGTGFTPRGWNTEQPSFDPNPQVFTRPFDEVTDDLHDRHVNVVVHVVPHDRDVLPTLHGTIPPASGETLAAGHIATYWPRHEGLMRDGVDAFWPDEGDWFDLFERIKRHQMYYQGPLSTRPNVRPWSLHRNGHLGVARWGGWMWSGDTESTWKSLEAQIAVGLNHSLSLSPFWGSDIGGFYPTATDELTGELYARWFQFGAFCPSFRSHGRTWWMRLPWGWGLSELGPLETRTPPPTSALNDHRIEPIARTYAELRYRLLPYNYTLAWQAHDAGMPMMRALWLHYPDDEKARGIGDAYLWGRDLLVAPVYERGATSRDVYLPEGRWYDFWTHRRFEGKQEVSREVDLSTMPLYVRAGAILPMDPVRQYTDEPVGEPMTLRIYPGRDGAFVLYEDDGHSLDYLTGESTRTRFTWDDEARQLYIAPVTEEDAVQAPPRTFRVRLMGEDVEQTVTYAGQGIGVHFDR